MKTYKKGISLIVLVITILVLAILATTVIVSLSNTNIITEAKKAAFKSDMKNYQSMLSVYIADESFNKASSGGLKLSEINAVNGDETFTKIFGDNVPAKYADKLMVSQGKIVFVTEDEMELAVLAELGISSTKPAPVAHEEWFTNCTITELPEYYYGSLTVGDACFDSATGTIYSVNLPEGVTEFTVPEYINGVKVNYVSGDEGNLGESITFMPSTITKVYVPAGITLTSGAFTGSSTLEKEIELVAAGPIVIRGANGPVISLSANSTIELADGSYFDFGGAMGLEKAKIDFGSADVTIGESGLEELQENFKIDEGKYQLPSNLDVHGANFGIAMRIGETWLVSQQQFNKILDDLEDYGWKANYVVVNSNTVQLVWPFSSGTQYGANLQIMDIETPFDKTDVTISCSLEDGTPCFDEATGILYKAILPSVLTEYTVPEYINGVKVKAISGTVSNGSVTSHMPKTINKVILPAGIELLPGAFSSTGDTKTIELVTTAPVKITATNGPVINLSSATPITLAEGSVISGNGYTGLVGKGIDYGSATIDFTYDIVKNVFSDFKESDEIYKLPKNIILEYTGYESQLRDFANVTFYMTEEQLEILNYDYYWEKVADGKYKNVINSFEEVLTEVYIQIWE